jgi:hypothetical protein
MAICTACSRQLTDIETYGSIDMPMCWDCHSSAMFDGDPPDTINADIYAAESGYDQKERTAMNTYRFAVRVDARSPQRGMTSG